MRSTNPITLERKRGDRGKRRPSAAAADRIKAGRGGNAGLDRSSRINVEILARGTIDRSGGAIDNLWAGAGKSVVAALRDVQRNPGTGLCPIDARRKDRIIIISAAEGAGIQRFPNEGVATRTRFNRFNALRETKTSFRITNHFDGAGTLDATAAVGIRAMQELEKQTSLGVFSERIVAHDMAEIFACSRVGNLAGVRWDRVSGSVEASVIVVELVADVDKVGMPVHVVDRTPHISGFAKRG
jgi:hypothetical protein